MRRNQLKPTLVVVGAGLSGATVAERAARALGYHVVLFEKRDHVGGNSHSARDPATGIEVHTYGSHIFHTDKPEVWTYIQRFGEFNHYRHRVWLTSRGRIFPLPVNLATINAFYRRSFSPTEARAFLAARLRREARQRPRNLEEQAIARIGRGLYERLIKGYTTKQWGRSPTQLPAAIVTRLPVRYDYRQDYFDDPWQGIPLQGYGRLVERMLDTAGIELHLGTDYLEVRDRFPARTPVIFTGPLDRFGGYRFGPLAWRAVRFEYQTLPIPDYQGTAVMNHGDLTVPYTRIHEFRHFRPELDAGSRTVIAREYARDAGSADEPAYPVRAPADRQRCRRYLAAAAKEWPQVRFSGRLGTYAYLDMDDAIAAALDLCRSLVR